MNLGHSALLLVAAGTIGGVTQPGAATLQSDLPHVVLETELGRIVIAVDTIRAPVTATNFLRYVDGAYYANGRFYRSVTMDNQPNNDVRIEVIQGGSDPERRSERFAAIPLERTNVTGLRHLDGTVSMARGGPDTARAAFFICVGDQPELDFGGSRNEDGQGFAAFGQVVEGMDVARRIHARPVDGQRLTEPVVISEARRIRL